MKTFRKIFLSSILLIITCIASYSQTHTLNHDPTVFLHKWIATDGNKAYHFTITKTTVTIPYSTETIERLYGKLEYYVNGSLSRTIDSYSNSGSTIRGTVGYSPNTAFFTFKDVENGITGDLVFSVNATPYYDASWKIRRKGWAVNAGAMEVDRDFDIPKDLTFLKYVNPLSYSNIPVSPVPYLGTKLEHLTPPVEMINVTENHIQESVDRTLWSDLALKIPLSNTADRFYVYRRFSSSSGNYQIILGKLEWGEYGKKMLITVSPEGTLIDQLEVSAWGPPCPGEPHVQSTWYMKQWKLLQEAVEVYQYEMYGSRILLFSDANYGSIYMLPVKTTYQIDNSGHFIQTNREAQNASGYYPTTFANTDINLWDIFN